MFNILVVDDEKEITDLIEIYLKGEGYSVVKAYNGSEALCFIKQNNFQLIILDVMMPVVGGVDVCIEIRKFSNIPIIMLSAKSEDMDKIYGLTTGADDYITKPFNPLELIARVKSQLRRYTVLNPNTNASGNDDIITVDDLTIDLNSHDVILGDNRRVCLTPTEFDILLFLAKNKGRVFSTEEIFEKVWKERFFESNNTVMVHIRKIREKIEINPRQPRYIKTIWGVGYKIEK